ncbi:replication initiator protein A [Sporosarcina sp. BP05]|uniref:replication initiator protein A n=1 Tax=Sporosarcina sp. BP05 TaxID=2758726 RepID=UPI0016471D50|nr:replication initiator protein A [Sporosarcina sp. BP05]
MNNQYVTIYEEYKHKFFQLPQVFFVSGKYKDMSNNAKVAWSILRDRSSLSRQNRWFDVDTGRIYFIFKNEELMKMLNITSEATVVKIKKELVNAGLIEQFRQGYNRPNKMYLLYPEVVMDDIYKIDEFENYTTEPDGTPKQIEGSNASALEPQGTLKNEAPKNEVPELQKMKPNNTEVNNTSFKTDKTLDTIDTETDLSTIKLNGSSLSEQDEFMVNAFFRNNRVPEQLGRCLKVFSTSLEEAEYYAGVIFRAKKEIEKDSGFHFFLEDRLDVEMAVVDSFTRAIRKIKRGNSKDEKIVNNEAYIYRCVFTALKDHFGPIFYSKQNDDGNDTPQYNENGVKKVPLYDWLEEREG